jgi:hypothetical protein
VSAGSGAWLRRQREACGWSRQELAILITDAAVTAPAPALESYISRWEAGKVGISARYRQPGRDQRPLRALPGMHHRMRSRRVLGARLRWCI